MMSRLSSTTAYPRKRPIPPDSAGAACGINIVV